MMRYEIYIFFCGFALCLAIPTNPVLITNPYTLAFQNGNRRFNPSNQYMKTGRPDRSSFVIGDTSSKNTKKSPFLRNDGHSSPSAVFLPGMAPSIKGKKPKPVPFEIGSGSGDYEGNSGFPSGIIFPSSMPAREPMNPPSEVSKPKDSASDCKIEDVQILFMNKCQNLLTEQACSAGQWLLVNKRGLPYCAMKPCNNNQLFYKGKCVNASDTSVCGVSEILYMEFTGEVYCDCIPLNVFDPSANQCFAQHDQGSCPAGKYLDLDFENNVYCADNPCIQANLVQNPINGECYKKLYKGSCKKSNGYDLVFNKDKTATCAVIHNRNIFEVPALTSCPAGSKRDYLGNCQKVFRLDSGGPFTHRVPSQQVSRYSQCSHGSIKYPDGSCRKINSLLGK